MADRVIIRAHGSVLASVIAAMIFGGLATFGLRIVIVALGLGEAGLWVWLVLAVSVALLWAVVHALWSAFGVALIVSRSGIAKSGPFSIRRVAADGLRVGRHDTLRRAFTGGSANMTSRVIETTEFWALSPTHGTMLLWDGPRGINDVVRIENACVDVLGLQVERLGQGGATGFE